MARRSELAVMARTQAQARKVGIPNASPRRSLAELTANSSMILRNAFQRLRITLIRQICVLEDFTEERRDARILGASYVMPSPCRGQASRVPPKAGLAEAGPAC